MKVLVTGSRGRVGRAVVGALRARGHRVVGTDLARPVWDRDWDEGPYVQADLTDAGAAYAVVRGHDVVVHTAAIPTPAFHPAHVVFNNNVSAAFNVLEAAVRCDLTRVVNISSEVVAGHIFAERPVPPAYIPIDEDYPPAPQDPYSLAKLLTELMCDAAVRRSDVRCTSLRPSWVQWEGGYERNLAALVREPLEDNDNLWSYVDVYDLADAVVAAAECDLPGHEVFNISAAETIGSHDLRAAVRRKFGDAVPVRPLDRPDASGVCSAKAQRLLGWRPRRSWRDYLDETGRARAAWNGEGPSYPGPVAVRPVDAP